MRTVPLVLHVPAADFDRLYALSGAETPQQLGLRAFSLGLARLAAPPASPPPVPEPAPYARQPPALVPPPLAAAEPAAPTIAAEPGRTPPGKRGRGKAERKTKADLTRQDLKLIRSYAKQGVAFSTIARRARVPLYLIEEVVAS